MLFCVTNNGRHDVVSASSVADAWRLWPSATSIAPVGQPVANPNVKPGWLDVKTGTVFRYKGEAYCCFSDQAAIRLYDLRTKLLLDDAYPVLLFTDEPRKQVCWSDFSQFH